MIREDAGVAQNVSLAVLLHVAYAQSSDRPDGFASRLSLMCECAARSACGWWLRRDAPLPVSVMGWTEVPNGAERCRHAHSAQPTVCPRAIAHPHRASAVALRVAQLRAAPVSCNSASERQSRLPVPLFISLCVRALAALSRALSMASNS